MRCGILDLIWKQCDGSDLESDRCDQARLKPQKESCFMGFLRKDGRAAVRNEIWIIPTVGCVNGVAGTLAKENQDFVRGSVEGIYAFSHPFGCSQTGADHAQTRKLLAALANIHR